LGGTSGFTAGKGILSHRFWLLYAGGVLNAGKLLFFAGLIITAVGVLLLASGKLNLPLGRLPGDIHYEGKSFNFYFPLATGLVISLVLSLVLWLISRR
jgi:Protein of unknown function (DUF2905)